MLEVGRKVMGIERSTYLIDEDGVIVKVDVKRIELKFILN